MKPLNYALLKYFTTVEEASVLEVMTALKETYGHFKAFNQRAILTALMTAQANGILEESRFVLDSAGELHVYFRAHAQGAAIIHRFIKN